MSEFDPLLTIRQFWYCDSVRAIKSRIAGACRTLRNLAPNLADGERVRRGFASYTTVTAPTGMELLKVVPIQSPSQEDVHVWFASDSGQKVYVNPTWKAGAKDTTNILINETKTFTGVGGSVSTVTLTITGSDALTLSQVNDYYNNWRMTNTTLSYSALVVDYSYSSAAAGTSVFTLLENVATFSWVHTNTYALYRNFHNNPTFAPTYSTSLSTPPQASSDNSIVKFSGGCVAGTGYRGIHYTPLLKRAFFPTVTSKTFSFNDSYVSERQLKALTKAEISPLGAYIVTMDNGLLTDRTYWLAFAPVYDGFQIGELTEYNASTDYASGGTGWTNNYATTTSASGATATAVLAGTTVASITGVTGGAGYTGTPDVAITGGGGSGATATAVRAGTVILGYIVTSGGSGYTSVPMVTIGGITPGGASIQATATATLNSTSVASFIVTNGGSGYVTAPTIELIGGGGTGATAYATLSGSSLATIVISAAGSGYTSAPTVSISGGGGIGNALLFYIKLSAASLNKRLTGINVYMAYDEGDTHSSGRIAQYQSLGLVSLTQTAATMPVWGGAWGYDTGSEKFVFTVRIDQSILEQAGNTYVTDSGMAEVQTDTMYGYSDEIKVGGYNLISNAYVTSESFLDRQNIFINPVGGNSVINSGVVQPDSFPNESGFYRLKAEPTIGSKITAMRQLGIGELLLLKDRGILLARLIVNSEGFVEFIWQIVDFDAGCASVAQSVQSEDGYIYFGGYEDIYRYGARGLERLIEREDRNDWLSDYRQTITKSAKESTVLTYLPEGIVLFDINQASGQQYELYTQFIPYGWRQANYKDTAGVSTVFFKWFAKLQNGTVLGITSTSPVVYQFSNPSTGAYYSTDAGTSIRVALDTGDLVTSGTETRNTVADRWEVSRSYLSPTTGTLDSQLYVDSVAISSPASLDKTSYNLRIPYRSDIRRTGNTHRLSYNVNASPEVMNAGTAFQINSVSLFGHTIPRTAEITVAAGASDVTPQTGTISGRHEFLIVVPNTWETFTFDNAFPATNVYTSLNGNTSEPTWRMNISEARTNTGADVAQADVLIKDRTLTGFKARSAEANTLCQYSIPEN